MKQSQITYKITNGLFGWGEFGVMNLDFRAQIQILCLGDLKTLCLKAQINGFQITS